MIAIPKPDKNTKHIENYRPITLLEVTGKLLEKIINYRIVPLLETTQAINDRHYGFRKNRSTQAAIAIITELIAIATAKRHQTNIILRDVSKAFDKVWHQGMIYKILQTEIHNIYKHILIDYLQDRQTTINIGNYTGPPIPLLSGIPQGGCLSPTLYILYTSDIPEPAPYSDHIMFADDITQIVSYPGKSTEIMARHTERAIENINQFENKWKIKTNTQKFKIIPIAKNKTSPITINNQIINYSNEGKMLGLTITKTGYRKHITNQINKLRATAAKLKRFKQLSTSNKKQLYTALQRSIIEYPAVPTCSLRKTNIKKLQIIQNNAMRFIYNIKYTDRITNAELHRRAELPTINSLLHDRAQTIWRKIQDNDNTYYQNKIENEHTEESHYWFTRTNNIINQPTPEPKY